METANVDLLVILARLGERFVIVTLVLGICILLMRVYRDKIQKIDLNLDAGGAKGGVIASFSMPVFLLLTLVAFAYLAFSNPIHYSRITVPSTEEERSRSLPDPVGKIDYVGLTGTADEMREWIGALGIIGAAVGQLNDLRTSEILKDGDALQAVESIFGQADDLTSLRFYLLDKLHPEGNPRQNCLQYVGPSSAPPSPECAGYVEDFMIGVKQ